MDATKVTRNQQIKALLLCTIAFGLVYHFSALYAKNLPKVASVVFEFEQHIPFVSWLIIPYMTSGFFFVCVFFWTKNLNELRILTQRMLFIILSAGVCYWVFPLKFSFEKPEVSNFLLKPLFVFLEKYDSPFNQAPSLHIAFAGIFAIEGNAHFTGFRKFFLNIWLLLLATSTVLVYQHHLIDVVTGIALSLLSFLLFKNNY